MLKFASLLILLSNTAFALSSRSLVGTWQLTSYTILESGGEKPWCHQPVGIISYLPNGFMAVGINCRDEKGEWIKDPKDMVFYTGRYEIRKDGVIVHHVEHSSELSRVGQDLERTAVLEKDTLTLTGKGTKGQVKLIWKKRA